MFAMAYPDTRSWMQVLALEILRPSGVILIYCFRTYSWCASEKGHNILTVQVSGHSLASSWFWSTSTFSPYQNNRILEQGYSFARQQRPAVPLSHSDSCFYITRSYLASFHSWKYRWPSSACTNKHHHQSEYMPTLGELYLNNVCVKRPQSHPNFLSQQPYGLMH